MPPADLADRSHVLQRDRLAPAGVVRHGEHDQRDALATDPFDQLLERGRVHVPLEGMAAVGVGSLGDDEVQRLGPGVLDVGPGRVEVGVVRHDVPRLAQGAEQQAFGGAPLVRGQDVLVAEDVPHRTLEAVEAAAAGVALVAVHEGPPLPGAHRPGARVGQQVDDDRLGGQQEDVVVRALEVLRPLLPSGRADRLDRLDLERLHHGVHAVTLLARNGPLGRSKATRYDRTMKVGR